MTWAGLICRLASRIATRRISWTDQRISGISVWSPLLSSSGVPCSLFFGGRRRHLVRMMADRAHHGEGQHDQRDVTMPAVPRAGLVVRQPEFGLRGLEGILDCPAVPFDRNQGGDPGSGRAPGLEEGQLAVAETAADQKTARPQSG